MEFKKIYKDEQPRPLNDTQKALRKDRETSIKIPLDEDDLKKAEDWFNSLPPISDNEIRRISALLDEVLEEIVAESFGSAVWKRTEKSPTLEDLITKPDNK